MNIILCSGDQIQGQSIVLLEGKSIDMERKTVTITIDNVPEELLQDFWKLAIREARKNTGVPIERTENIKADFNLMEGNEDCIGELFSAAAAFHIAYTAEKILNS